MLIKQEKIFNSRDDLDAHIRSRYGDDSNKNKDITLEMSTEEMSKLSLSEKNTVYGVKIKKS